MNLHVSHTYLRFDILLVQKCYGITSKLKRVEFWNLQVASLSKTSLCSSSCKFIITCILIAFVKAKWKFFVFVTPYNCLWTVTPSTVCKNKIRNVTIMMQGIILKCQCQWQCFVLFVWVLLVSTWANTKMKVNFWVGFSN